MHTDVKGCSTCPAGQEQHEPFISATNHRSYVQYEYRKPTGELFTCIATTVEAARKKRDNWLRDLIRREG